MLPRSSPFIVFLATVIVALLFVSSGVAVEQRSAPATWITAWGNTQAGLGETVITNATVRMIARVTIAGEEVRVRLDNTFGTRPLTIGKAYLGQRLQGAALIAGSNRPISFNRSPSVTIPAGGRVVSDPVSMKVLAQQDLAVSLYIPEADVKPSQHAGARVTSFLSAAGSGDVGADEAAAPHRHDYLDVVAEGNRRAFFIRDWSDRRIRRLDHRRLLRHYGRLRSMA